METCTEAFARLTAPLQGLQCGGHAFVKFSNPFDLQNWTFPVIEVLLIVGAVAGLLHAIRWYRERDDSTNLVAWCALTLAPLVIEPITYFPNWFGLEKYLGLTFAHGQFSVQFMYDRLPLYIVAMYPVYGYVAFALVQRAGVLKKYNPVIGASCVATGFLALFEVVDTVGPQWGWWIWNSEVPQSHPSVGPIPVTSIQMFSIAVPFAVTLVTLLICRRQPRPGWRIVRDVFVVSIGVWPIMMANSVMASLLELLGLSLESARWVWLWALVATGLAITTYAFVGVARGRRAAAEHPEIVDQQPDWFGAACVAVYLVFGLVFWGAALPAYLTADNGLTSEGLRTGNIVVGVAAVLASIAFTAGAYLGDSPLSSRGHRPARTVASAGQIRALS